MSVKLQYIAVNAWCGFDAPHPPHLWPEVSEGWPEGSRINMMPCRGHRESDHDH